MRFFWLNRNNQGLEEIGYPLTEAQLRKLVKDMPGCFASNISVLLDEKSNIEVEGGVCGNDTFSVVEVDSMDALKDLITWKDFDPQESHASGEFDEEYPEFVDNKYRLSRYIYQFTGYTDVNLPYSDEENPTYKFLMSEFNLTEEDMYYKATNEEKAAKEIADCIKECGTIHMNGYVSILLSYGLVKAVGVQAYPYASQHGVIRVPENLNDEQIKDFVRDNWDLVHFEPAELDYCGTDFELDYDMESENESPKVAHKHILDSSEQIRIAIDAFDLEQHIEGTLTGGIAPIKILLGIQVVDDEAIAIKYTYPNTCGLSDCRYHVTDAGKELSSLYEFKNDKLYINGKEAFESCDLVDREIKEFYNKWGFNN